MSCLLHDGCYAGHTADGACECCFLGPATPHPKATLGLSGLETPPVTGMRFTYSHTVTHTHAYTYTHTCIHTHTHVRALTHACIHTHTHAYTHTHTHTHTLTHTRARTHTHLHCEWQCSQLNTLPIFLMPAGPLLRGCLHRSQPVSTLASLGCLSLALTLVRPDIQYC